MRPEFGVIASARCASWAEARRSNSHWHEDVAVLVLGVGILGAHLAGGLGILELQADFALVAEGFEEVENVDRVEADYDGVAGVGRVDGVLDRKSDV